MVRRHEFTEFVSQCPKVRTLERVFQRLSTSRRGVTVGSLGKQVLHPDLINCGSKVHRV